MGIGVAGGEFNIRQAILENNKEFMNEIYGSEQVPEGMDYRISEKFYNYFWKCMTTSISCICRSC